MDLPKPDEASVPTFRVWEQDAGDVVLDLVKHLRCGERISAATDEEARPDEFGVVFDDVSFLVVSEIADRENEIPHVVADLDSHFQFRLGMTACQGRG